MSQPFVHPVGLDKGGWLHRRTVLFILMMSVVRQQCVEGLIEYDDDEFYAHQWQRILLHVENTNWQEQV